MEYKRSSMEDNIERFYWKIHKTYTFIVGNYFHPITEQFEPFITENQMESKIGLLEVLKNSLYYWFDIVDKEIPDVKIVSSNQLSQASQEYQTIFFKNHSNGQHITNLELSGLVGIVGKNNNRCY